MLLSILLITQTFLLIRTRSCASACNGDFSSFQTNITCFIPNKCEKCPSSKQCWDSNPHPSEHESPPITTWGGLLHNEGPTNFLLENWTSSKLLKLLEPASGSETASRIWRLVSGQLSNKFVYCPSWTISTVLAFHKHNSLPLGHIQAFISFY